MASNATADPGEDTGVCLRVPRRDLESVDRLAAAHFDGNRSMAIRALLRIAVRKVADGEGLWLPESMPGHPGRN